MSTVVAAVVAAAALAGCGSGSDWSSPRPQARHVGTVTSGFLYPDASPSPEATVTPRPGSWDAVHPAKGYRVVLLSAGHDKPTRTLVTAIERWAKDEHVSLKRVTATSPSRLLPSVQRAIDLKPHLIISAGNGLVDPLTTVTPSVLDQQFLVIGADLPEPTENVTSADWNGATFRGTDVAAATPYDPATFTLERAGRAVRAGVAAVLSRLTGIVIWLS